MEEEEEVVYTAGQQIELYDAPIFINPSNTKVEEQKTGTFYLWNDQPKNERIRICKDADYAGVPGMTIGWINVEDIDKEPEIIPNTGDKPSFAVGQKVTLRATKVYATSVDTNVSAVKTGGFYIWSAAQANNRIRITNDLSYVGKKDKITGWVNIYEITS